MVIFLFMRPRVLIQCAFVAKTLSTLLTGVWKLPGVSPYVLMNNYHN